MALRLAKEGYGGGDPEKVLRMPVEIVLTAWQYERFRDEYERTFMELNREDKWE